MISGPPTVQPIVVSVSWTAAGFSDPLVTGIRYALYSQCGAETTFQLIDDDIQGLSYDITTLPSLTQCVLRVVVYSDHCLLDVNSLLGDTTDIFTTGELMLLKLPNSLETLSKYCFSYTDEVYSKMSDTWSNWQQTYILYPNSQLVCIG